jgi:phospholipase A-2-activating protein
VVDSTGSSGRKVPYKGKEYDYVFDVDIEEGKPPLKLPYNLTQNPYEAATKLLGDNELPISYIDQVSQFIVTNTKGATIGQTAEAPSADPFGTESRYQPDQTQPKKYLPHTEYLALTQAKWEPVAKKLKSLNEKHLLAGNKHIAMNPDGVSSLETVLQATMGKPSQKTGPPALLEAQRSVYMLLTQWPYSDRLPAIDVLRCFVAWPGSASLQDAKYGNLVDIVLRAALNTQDALPPTDEPLSELIKTFDASTLSINNVMMALRTVTNLFATPEGRDLAASEAPAIIGLVARIAGVDGDQRAIGADNNHLQIALTSATFNFTCLALNQRESIDLEQVMLLCQVAEAVIRRQSDPEVLFRALMALGMVLAIGGDARDLAKTLEVGEPVGEAAKKSGEARIKALAQECLAYLKQ